MVNYNYEIKRLWSHNYGIKKNTKIMILSHNDEINYKSQLWQKAKLSISISISTFVIIMTFLLWIYQSMFFISLSHVQTLNVVSQRGHQNNADYKSLSCTLTLYTTNTWNHAFHLNLNREWNHIRFPNHELQT